MRTRSGSSSPVLIEARPDLVEDPAALAAAAPICRDLDGLPLAIELAAARAKALTLDEIADRIGDRFRFLVSWRRLTPARHRTLRETMDWSYELLEPDRAVASRAIVGLRRRVHARRVGRRSAWTGDDDRALELVDRLVDASLVVAEVRAGRMRYRMLDTVRHYAAERLAEVGEMEAVHHRHADWCLALAERIEPELTGDRQTEAFATLEAEHDNFRAALGFVGLGRRAGAATPADRGADPLLVRPRIPRRKPALARAGAGRCRRRISAAPPPSVHGRRGGRPHPG